MKETLSANLVRIAYIYRLHSWTLMSLMCRVAVMLLPLPGDRPVESHSGARETIIAGPITTLIRMGRDRRGGNVGRGVPSPSDLGSGDRAS